MCCKCVLSKFVYGIGLNVHLLQIATLCTGTGIEYPNLVGKKKKKKKNVTNSTAGITLYEVKSYSLFCLAE